MLTDQHEMLELMKHNITLNQVGDKATASILNWYVPLLKPGPLSLFFLQRERQDERKPFLLVGD